MQDLSDLTDGRKADDSRTPQSSLYAITADMPDGQPLPPFIENGIPWRVVQRGNGRTLWQRGRP
jgi:hypothetical protein